MIREPPWLEPSACAGPNRSRPSTRCPRAARCAAAALPMPPSPTTITSNVTGSSNRRPLLALPQRRLEHLAAGVARQRTVQHADELRHLEVGELRARVRDEGRDEVAGRHPGPGQDDGAHLLPHHWI